MLELNTTDLASRKKVKIDGHIYTVRPSGAGDDMKLNMVLAQLKKLAEKADKNKNETAKDITTIAELQKQAIKVVSDRYDDGGDGSKAFDLITRLSPTDRYALEAQIFDLVPLEEISSLDTLAEIEKAKPEAK